MSYVRDIPYSDFLYTRSLLNSRHTSYARRDPDYMNMLNTAKSNYMIKSCSEWIEFNKTWVDVYKQVLGYW